MKIFTLPFRSGRHFILSLLLASLCAFDCYGQIFTTKESQPYLPLVPDAWQFMRYGKNTPNLYTGTVNVDIPIYTYKDEDFEFPISISYASNGYRPNDQQGLLGLGWSLSAGGMITREIVGIPDDYYEEGVSTTGYPHTRCGFYFYHQLPVTWDLFADLASEWRTSQENGKQLFNPYRYRVGNVGYETAPDIFSFKFGDHSGKFILGPENQIYVFNTNHPSGEYDIDFIMKDKQLISITIKTGDGYEYTFGNEHVQRYGRGTPSPSAKEYSAQDLYNYSTSWPLISIKVPKGDYTSGKNIYFDYDTFVVPEYELEPGKSGVPIAYQTYSPIVYEYGEQLANNATNYTCNYLIKRYTASIQTIIQYKLATISINSDETKIDFSYQDKKQQYYQEGNTGNTSYLKTLADTRGLLSGITVKYKNNIVKQYRFNYWYNPVAKQPDNNYTGNAIPFLSMITMPDNGVYRFDYYNLHLNAPYYGTTRFDYAGYYNCDTLTNTLTDYGLSRIYQEVNPKGALFGMLKKITYPTGGYTLFTYEPHDYSKIMVRHPSDILTAPYLIDAGGEDRQGAGLRIKTITDYVKRVPEKDSDDVLTYLSGYLFDPDSVIRHEYIYQDNGRSSGNCLTYARQIYDKRPQMSPSSIESNGITGIPGPEDIMNTSLKIPLSVDKTGIEYHTVIEKLSDGSTRRYRFSSYDDLPDEALRIVMVDHLGTEAIKNPTFIDMPSLCSQRGKLLCVESYDPENKLVLKQEHVYSREPLKTITYLKSLTSRYYTTQHYVEDYPLEAIKTTRYFDTDSLQTVQHISYNALKQPQTIETYNNSKLENTLSIKYLHEQYSGNLWNTIVNQNLSSYVAEQQSRNSADGEHVGVQRQIFDYMLTSAQQIRPKSTSTVNYIENDIDIPEAQCEITFDKYDSNGRILQTRDRNGTPISYIWSSGQQHLLAKVFNVFYNDLPQLNPGDARLTDAQKTQLRAIPGALVETYDYIPLIGLSKYVDTNGVETNYEYYPSGKLKYIKDATGNIISEYDYSLK